MPKLGNNELRAKINNNTADRFGLPLHGHNIKLQML
jgi:hypothetical protein